MRKVNRNFPPHKLYKHYASRIHMQSPVIKGFERSRLCRNKILFQIINKSNFLYKYKIN